MNDIDHWFLCVIDLQQEEVYILDSLPNKKRKIERLDMVRVKLDNSWFLSIGIQICISLNLKDMTNVAGQINY